MDRFGVQLALENLSEAMWMWKRSFIDFRAAYEKAMTRLLHEAMINQMSAEQFAKFSGMTVKSVRMLMRRSGFDPKKGRRFLSDAAATALQRNAELMGIDPLKVDLTSPLAYLPGGSQLQRAYDSEAVRGVKDEEIIPLDFEVIAVRFQEMVKRAGCVVRYPEPVDGCDGEDIRVSSCGFPGPGEQERWGLTRDQLALVLGVDL